MTYHHPVFDADAVRSQGLLPQLQGRDRLWFCGSYFGYGFHEDALASAVSVARQLGAETPWTVPESARPGSRAAAPVAASGLAAS
jgi:predicted NAD/FAD-binding protein